MLYSSATFAAHLTGRAAAILVRAPLVVFLTVGQLFRLDGDVAVAFVFPFFCLRSHLSLHSLEGSESLDLCKDLLMLVESGT